MSKKHVIWYCDTTTTRKHTIPKPETTMRNARVFVGMHLWALKGNNTQMHRSMETTATRSISTYPNPNNVMMRLCVMYWCTGPKR